MTSFVETKLEGYVRAEFQKEGPIYDILKSDGTLSPEQEAKMDDWRGPPVDAKIYNARELQAAFEGTKAEFFNQHGFVLLDSETKVTEWNTSYTVTDSQITTKYAAEVEAHLRHDLELDQ